MKKLLIVFVVLAFTACNTGVKKTNDETAKSTELIVSTIDIGGLHCNNCVASVEKGIKSLSGIEEVKVTLDDSTAIVKYDATTLDIEDIKKTIEKRGYKVKSVK